ncbi:MAG TPA: efflux RND transporter periplasmic adaptor subunit [Polyangiales bacterium]|nr:efflux RND transporter periplasmic adaptor subunit [Polyangiales bacterium]
MDDLSSDLASLKIDRSPRSESGGGFTRIVTWVIALLALAGLAVWLYPKVEAQLFKTEVQTSTILEVSPSLAVTSLTATGYVIAERRSKVGANVPGRIGKLYVREGSQVKRGDVLVELDVVDQKSNVVAAQARVLSAQAKEASARASLHELQVQLDRQKVLLGQNAAARSIIDDLEARIGTAQAAITASIAETRAASAQVDVAKSMLARMTVSAPIDGTVLDKPREAGETVDLNSPLMEIADMQSLVVEIDVPEGRLSLVKIGGPCEIALDAFGGQRFSGKVREIGKRVNRSKATIPVKVEFVDVPPDAAPLPDMSARVSFLTQALDDKARTAQSKLMVPLKAVSTRDGKSYVFVVEGGAVRMEPVTLGEKNGDAFELTEGPTAGTKVVVSPDATLQSGQRVKERKD